MITYVFRMSEIRQNSQTIQESPSNQNTFDMDNHHIVLIRLYLWSNASLPPSITRQISFRIEES